MNSSERGSGEPGLIWKTGTSLLRRVVLSLPPKVLQLLQFDWQEKWGLGAYRSSVALGGPPTLLIVAVCLF